MDFVAPHEKLERSSKRQGNHSSRKDVETNRHSEELSCVLEDD